MTLEDPVIITCSISGSLANREQCAAIPYTPAEYAAEARRAVDEGAAMIHIHARTADGAPRLRRVLLGRVGDRRALLAIRDRPGDRAADDHRVLEAAHTGITPCFFQGRSTRLSFAIRSPRITVGRVSRGSITSSIRAFLAAM